MKLTAKLAYSQLKINRSRTKWTLVGITLSTALMTAVCSFVASGRALFVGIWGESYIEESGAIGILLPFIACILGAIIVSMSVAVISNAFQTSAAERTAQFGILKSVGATGRQISATVMYESFFLSAVGIPLGIVVGLVLSFVGIQVANHYFGEINSLIHIMMNELTVVLDFVISWQALLAAAAISFCVVLSSAWRPARHAARLTAIEGIRGSGEVKMDAKQVHTSALTQKMFGFEGTLAAKNMKRSRRSFRASVVSLTVGIVLFINLSSLGAQVGEIADMIYPDVDASVMVDYTSARDFIINAETGRDEVVFIAPIDSRTGDAVSARLREYPDINVFGSGSDMETYAARIPHNILSSQLPQGVLYTEESVEYELPVELITIDPLNYAMLCDRAGVPLGSNIILNIYSYNDNGQERVIQPFIIEEKNLRLVAADGSLLDMPVHGELLPEDIPNELLAPNTHPVRLIIPQGEMRGYIWFADPADVTGFIEYANTVMEEFFPNDADLGYMELGFTTRVYEIQDYMKIMNIAIVLVQVFAYCFVAMLMLIGLTNVISTMTANVRMRSREFAVFQSVGMTRNGLKRMLNLESFMCSIQSLIIGLPIAIALTYLIHLLIRDVFPIPYQLPWLAALLCVAGVFIITWLTMRHAAARMKNDNIIETIRSVTQ